MEANSTEYNREYYEQHKELIKNRSREYRLAHNEQTKVYLREYYRTHKGRYLEVGRQLDQKRRLQVLEHYSKGVPQCAHCGILDTDVLCLDHINDDGHKHRQSLGRGSIYWWIIKNDFPEGFQVLCHNCNWKKRLIVLRKIQHNNEAWGRRLKVPAQT